jgi:hypothetical protein
VQLRPLQYAGPAGRFHRQALIVISLNGQPLLRGELFQGLPDSLPGVVPLYAVLHVLEGLGRFGVRDEVPKSAAILIALFEPCVKALGAV